MPQVRGDSLQLQVVRFVSNEQAKGSVGPVHRGSDDGASAPEASLRVRTWSQVVLRVYELALADAASCGSDNNVIRALVWCNGCGIVQFDFYISTAMLEETVEDIETFRDGHSFYEFNGRCENCRNKKHPMTRAVERRDAERARKERNRY